MVSRAVLGLGLLCVVLLAALAPSRVVAEEEAPDAPVDWNARAITAWGKTCQKCHAVPDTKYETDRAFLGQIMETT